MKVRISILDKLQPVHVELEHPNAVGVLVGRDEPLAARVELEVPRRHAARVEDADRPRTLLSLPKKIHRTLVMD